jgi:hypothetical protein
VLEKSTLWLHFSYAFKVLKRRSYCIQMLLNMKVVFSWPNFATTEVLRISLFSFIDFFFGILK